jgi:protoheme ferro-lyase
MVIWLALVVGAVCTGASFVGILVARRSLEPAVALAGLASFIACAWGFGSITVIYDRLDAIIYAFIFGLAGIAGGYALVSTLLSAIALHDRPAHLGESLPDDVGTAAVVLLGEVEPAEYSPRATAAALDQLAGEGLLSASIGVLPFLFMAQKTRYRAAGGVSPAQGQLDELARRITSALRTFPVGDVASAWCEGEDALATRVAEAASRGFRTVIVAEALIADSLEVDHAKRAVDALRLHSAGVSVSYSGPLCGSETVAKLVAARTLEKVGETASAGVVLVGQGQPEERSRSHREFDEQETAFLNRVRLLLVEHGIAEQNARIAWSDWRAPEVTSTVRHLAALGCREIVVMPACYPLDSISTLLDLPLAVRQARVDDTVSVVTLPSWHDDPGLIEALRVEIAACVAAAAG